jgi:hypothetical protein
VFCVLLCIVVAFDELTMEEEEEVGVGWIGCLRPRLGEQQQCDAVVTLCLTTIIFGLLILQS